MIRLPLRARDGSVRAYALIDDEDGDTVGVHTWSLSRTGYPVRNAGGHRNVYLHVELFRDELEPGLSVDHINRNRLDNRRSNLRLIPLKAQPQNQSGHRDGTSQYRGVCRRDGRWRAQVGSVYLGTYNREIDAAAAAAQYRAEHLPYAVEDEALLRHRPGNAKSRRRPGQNEMTPATAMAIRLTRASTSLSYRKIAEMFGVGFGATQAVLDGRTFKYPSHHLDDELWDEERRPFLRLVEAA